MKFNFIITIIHNVQSFKDKIGIETDREILKVKLIKITNHQEKPKQIQAKCQVNPPHPLENEDNNTYLKKERHFWGVRTACLGPSKANLIFLSEHIDYYTKGKKEFFLQEKHSNPHLGNIIRKMTTTQS